LFYTTQIPVCLWFLTKNKQENPIHGYRNREGETLFIDARNMGSMIDRTQKDLTKVEIAKITQTYHAWRGEEKDGNYEYVDGYSKSASLEEIKANDYVLTPGRYVGIAEEEDDGIHFEDRMKKLSTILYSPMNQGNLLDIEIKGILDSIGYGN
jgi:type I restriction enzyme M protein